MHVRSDSLPHLIVGPFCTYCTLLRRTDQLLRHLLDRMRLVRGLAVLVSDLGCVTTVENDGLVHVGLTGHAVVHRVCVLFGKRLAC